jgi:hypothetical protein
LEDQLVATGCRGGSASNGAGPARVPIVTKNSANNQAKRELDAATISLRARQFMTKKMVSARSRLTRGIHENYLRWLGFGLCFAGSQAYKGVGMEKRTKQRARR